MQNEVCNIVSQMGEEGRDCGMGMVHSGKRGMTRQIRDLIHQTDNGAKVTKELEAALVRSEKERVY